MLSCRQLTQLRESARPYFAHILPLAQGEKPRALGFGMRRAHSHGAAAGRTGKRGEATAGCASGSLAESSAGKAFHSPTDPASSGYEPKTLSRAAATSSRVAAAVETLKWSRGPDGRMFSREPVPDPRPDEERGGRLNVVDVQQKSPQKQQTPQPDQQRSTQQTQPELQMQHLKSPTAAASAADEIHKSQEKQQPDIERRKAVEAPPQPAVVASKDRLVEIPQAALATANDRAAAVQIRTPLPSEEALASAALRFFRSSLTGGCARRARSSDAFFAALRPRQPKPQLADSSDVQPMQTQQAQSVTAEQLGIFKPVDTEGDSRDSAKTSMHIPDSGKEENRSTHAQAPKIENSPLGKVDLSKFDYMLKPLEKLPEQPVQARKVPEQSSTRSLAAGTAGTTAALSIPQADFAVWQQKVKASFDSQTAKPSFDSQRLTDSTDLQVLHEVAHTSETRRIPEFVQFSKENLEKTRIYGDLLPPKIDLKPNPEQPAISINAPSASDVPRFRRRLFGQSFADSAIGFIADPAVGVRAVGAGVGTHTGVPFADSAIGFVADPAVGVRSVNTGVGTRTEPLFVDSACGPDVVPAEGVERVNAPADKQAGQATKVGDDDAQPTFPSPPPSDDDGDESSDGGSDSGGGVGDVGEDRKIHASKEDPLGEELRKEIDKLVIPKVKDREAKTLTKYPDFQKLGLFDGESALHKWEEHNLDLIDASSQGQNGRVYYKYVKRKGTLAAQRRYRLQAPQDIATWRVSADERRFDNDALIAIDSTIGPKLRAAMRESGLHYPYKKDDHVIVSLTEGAPDPFDTIELMCFCLLGLFSAKPEESAELDRATAWFNVPDKLSEMYGELKKFRRNWDLKHILAPHARGVVVDDLRENLRYIHLAWSKVTSPELQEWRSVLNKRFEADHLSFQQDPEVLTQHFEFVLKQSERLVVCQERAFVADGARKSKAQVAGGVFQITPGAKGSVKSVGKSNGESDDSKIESKLREISKTPCPCWKEGWCSRAGFCELDHCPSVVKAGECSVCRLAGCKPENHEVARRKDGKPYVVYIKGKPQDKDSLKGWLTKSPWTDMKEEKKSKILDAMKVRDQKLIDAGLAARLPRSHIKHPDHSEWKKKFPKRKASGLYMLGKPDAAAEERKAQAKERKKVKKLEVRRLIELGKAADKEAADKEASDRGADAADNTEREPEGDGFGRPGPPGKVAFGKQKPIRPVKAARPALYGMSDSGAFRHALNASEARQAGVKQTGVTVVEAFNGDETVGEARKQGYAPELLVEVPNTRLIAENPLCESSNVKILRGRHKTHYIEMSDAQFDELLEAARSKASWSAELSRDQGCDYFDSATYRTLREKAGLQPLRAQSPSTGTVQQARNSISTESRIGRSEAEGHEETSKTRRGRWNNGATSSLKFADFSGCPILLAAVVATLGISVGEESADLNLAGVKAMSVQRQEECRAKCREGPGELGGVFNVDFGNASEAGLTANRSHSSWARMRKGFNATKWRSWAYMNTRDGIFDTLYTPAMHHERLVGLVRQANISMLELEALWTLSRRAVQPEHGRWSAEDLRRLRSTFECALIDLVGQVDADTGSGGGGVVKVGQKKPRPYDRCVNHSVHNPECPICRRIAMRLLTHWRAGSSLASGRFVGSLVIYVDLKTFPRSARNNRYMLYASMYLEAYWVADDGEDVDADVHGPVDRDGERGRWHYTGRIDIDVPLPRKDKLSLAYGWGIIRAEGRIPDDQRCYLHCDNESAIVLSTLLEELVGQNVQVINSLPYLHDSVAESQVKTRSQAGNRMTLGSNLGRLFWDNCGECLWMWGNSATYVVTDENLEEVVIPWKPLINQVPEFKLGCVGYSVVPAAGKTRAGEPRAQPVCPIGLAQRTTLGVRILFWQKRVRGSGGGVESWSLSQTVIPYNTIEFTSELAFERVVTNLVEEFKGVGPFEGAKISDALRSPDTVMTEERPGTAWACCLHCDTWRTTTREFERANDAGDRVARCELIPRATSTQVEEFWDCKDPPEDWGDEDEEELPGLREPVVVLDVGAPDAPDPPVLNAAASGGEEPAPRARGRENLPWNKDAVDFSSDVDVQKLQTLLDVRGGSVFLPNLRAYWKHIPRQVLKDKVSELGGCVLKVAPPGHAGVGCSACLCEDFGFAAPEHAADCRRHSGDPNTTPMEHFYECETCYARTTDAARAAIDASWQSDLARAAKSVRKSSPGPSSDPVDWSIFDDDKPPGLEGDDESTSCGESLAPSDSEDDEPLVAVVRASMKLAKPRAEARRLKFRERRRRKKLARMRDALEDHPAGKSTAVCVELADLTAAAERLSEIQAACGFISGLEEPSASPSTSAEHFPAGTVKLTRPVTPKEAREEFSYLDWEESDRKEADNMRTYNVFGMPKLDNAETRAAAGECFNVSDVIKVRAVKHVDRPPANQTAKTRGVANGKGTQNADGAPAVFAPYGLLPASLREIRVVICIACLLGFWVGQGDIEAAYLNATMPAGTYVRLNDFVYSCLSARAQSVVDALRAAGHKHILIELLSALYGHEQAGTRWQIKIEQILIDMDFKCFRDVSSAIFWLYENGRLVCMLILYVDDFVMAGVRKVVDRVIEALKQKGIVLSKWGRLEEMLGCVYRVTSTPQDDCTESVIDMDMRPYLNNLVREYESKYDVDRWVRTHPSFRREPVPGTPSDVDDPTAPADGVMKDDAPRIVGQLTWATRCGVPPLSQAINAIAGCLARWRKANDDGALRIMAWVREVAVNMVLSGTISTEDAAPLVGTLLLFVDADWAGDKRTRKSVSSYQIYFVGPHGSFLLLDWSSKRQTAVSLSSGEAELAALQYGLRELINVIGIFRAAGLSPALKILCDSNVAISIAASGLSSKMRHASATQGLSAQWIHETLAALKTRATKVDSAANASDLGTKPVPAADFDRYSRFLRWGPPSAGTRICRGMHASPLAHGDLWRCHVPVTGDKFCPSCAESARTGASVCQCWSCGWDTKTPQEVKDTHLIPI